MGLRSEHDPPRNRACGWTWGLTLALLGQASCYEGSQEADGGGEESGDDAGDLPQAPGEGVGHAGLRRLSRAEYDASVRDLLGDDTRPAATRMPEDIADPFDNDYPSQVASKPLVEALEALASDVAGRLTADPDRLLAVVGCIPEGPDDEACLRPFITRLGRRALRRPLREAEVDEFLALALAQDDASKAAELVVRALLQDPEFVFRVEIGEPTAEAGVFRLSDYEIATRLSYLLWGTTPDDVLLDAAEAGALGASADRREVALAMLEDPRARDRLDAFHAMWLGYVRLPHAPSLNEAMHAETRALVEQVVFERQESWLELFRAEETFLDTALAEHYGLPSPGATPGWVSYGDTGRQGILSHGSFLSVATSIADTSPTKRGQFVRRRLLCQEVPPPPPDVNADEPPTSDDSDCKWDAYARHRDRGETCRGCHELMDPIGFGLENYDHQGRFREHDDGLPGCTIDGDGRVDGVAFNGPAGLADALVDGDALASCAVEHVYRFAMGREPAPPDEPHLTALRDTFEQHDHRLDHLLVELVSSEAFAFRREE